MKPDYETILADCLDAVLSGRQSVNACAQAHPQHAESLRAELTVALLTTHLKPPEPSAEYVTAFEQTVIAPPAERVIRPGFVRHVAMRRVAGLLLAVLIVFGGSGTVVAASADSLPGDALYSIKRLWESVVVVIATVAGNVDDVYVQLAETRLEEARALAERGDLSTEHITDLQASVTTAVERIQVDSLPDLDQFIIEAEQALPALAAMAAQDEQTHAMVIELQATVDDVRQVTVPTLQSEWSTQQTMPPAVEPPPAQINPTATRQPTETASITMTATITPTPSATATTSQTPELDQPAMLPGTPTATWTPLFPATATRTPTFTPPATQTPSPVASPTATWTSFPTSTFGPTVPAQVPPASATSTRRPGAPPNRATPAPTRTPRSVYTPTVSPTWYPWIQATFDACYLTRTAEPDENRNDPYCQP
jgi:hypothetical protein